MEMLFDEENLDKFLDQVTESWTCPVCANKGITAHVKLYQGDDEHAIYFCETKDCVYPVTDDADAIVVNRSVVDRPVDAETLEEIGLPPSMLDEGELSIANAYEILLVTDAFKMFDDWVNLERDMTLLINQFSNNAETCQHEPCKRACQKVLLNPKCTPLNRLRSLPVDLIKFVKHVIPNIEEIVELLRLDVL